MIKVEALTLEDAYTKASSELKCSITDLNFEVIQQPKSGFLGFGKKNAIIVAVCKPSYKKAQNSEQPKKNKSKPYQQKTVNKDYTKEEIVVPVSKVDEKEENYKKVNKEIEDNFYSKTQAPTKKKNTKSTIADSKIKNQKYNNTNTPLSPSTLQKIKNEVQSLFNKTCFKIDTINLSLYDDNTLLIEIDGDDAALLIGKDGYRYKAISYILFNWLNQKYKVAIRLEISEFLQNQEEIIYKYVDSLRSKIEDNGRAKTKPLDGILIHIALHRLRTLYPNKYVGIKNSGNKSYIIINDFN